MVAHIVFSNYGLASIFENELIGQVSDGLWSNSKHDLNICRVKICVGSVPSSKFYGKRNYDFARKDLVDQVGERMWRYFVLGSYFEDKFPLVAYSFLADYTQVLYDTFKDEKLDEDSFVVYNINRWGITMKDVEDVMDLLENNPYDVKELRKQLRLIKKAVNPK